MANCYKGECKMLNKKGHVGTILMVLGAIVLVVTTLFSFSIFSDNAANEKTKLNYFISEFSFEQKYISVVLKDMVEEAIYETNAEDNFTNEFENSLKEIALRRRDSDRKTNLFGKLINEPLNLTSRESDYILSVNNIFVKLEKDKNFIERDLNITLVFNESEVLSESL